MNISTGKITKAQKICMYGVEGIGKTTLASHFPDPLFIDTEGSTAHLDVKRVDPAPSSWSMLMGYVTNVIADPSVCSTLVIDTADWAERLCVEHVLAKNDWSTIEAPGYGKGYREVNEEFGRLLDKLSDCVDKGINVVVTAHARVSKFEQPDELGAYDRWTLKLFDSPKSSNAAMLKEWADMVLFLNYKTIIAQPDSKTGGHAKAMGGKRVMYTTHTPAWDAKNRCGLADELPMDYASISHCIPVSSSPSTVAAPATAAIPSSVVAGGGSKEAEDDGDIFARAKEAQAENERILSEINGQDPKPDPAPVVDPGRTNLRKLRDLMAQSGVTDGDLEAYSFEHGYTPAGTPIDVYPEDACGYLVSQWQSIADEIAVPFN